MFRLFCGVWGSDWSRSSEASWGQLCKWGSLFSLWIHGFVHSVGDEGDRSDTMNHSSCKTGHIKVFPFTTNLEKPKQKCHFWFITEPFYWCATLLISTLTKQHFFSFWLMCVGVYWLSAFITFKELSILGESCCPQPVTRLFCLNFWNTRMCML